jgi:predicted RNA-binding Zn-ribbon protein involved in translation (DUF1610 family)
MEKKKIRIQTKSGKIIERNSEVTEWICPEYGELGQRITTAIVGNVAYQIKYRDYYGPVFFALGFRVKK